MQQQLVGCPAAVQGLIGPLLLLLLLVLAVRQWEQQALLPQQPAHKPQRSAQRRQVLARTPHFSCCRILRRAGGRASCMCRWAFMWGPCMGVWWAGGGPATVLWALLLML